MKRVISPFTVPFTTVAAMKKHRAQMQALRKAGRVARPEVVLENLERQDRATRIRGSEPVALARLFARGLLQGHILLKTPLGSHAEMAETFNAVWRELGLEEGAPKIWRKSDFKNAARGIWETRVIRPNLMLTGLLEDLCRAFAADVQEVKGMIFADEEVAAESQDLLEALLLALLHGAPMGIDPFPLLFLDGRIPPRQGLLAAYPQLTAERLALLESQPFTPGQRNPAERKRLIRLLYRIGITGAEAEACASVLAPSEMPIDHRQKSPRVKKCLEMFVQALYQPDITAKRPPNDKVLQRLAWYGLTRERFDQLRQIKFRRRDLSDTATNRCQIRAMARTLGLDPEPFFQALLDRSTE